MNAMTSDYIEQQARIGDNYYQDAVALARRNGVVSLSCIQDNFHLDTEACVHIVNRMTNEGLCNKNGSIVNKIVR